MKTRSLSGIAAAPRFSSDGWEIRNKKSPSSLGPWKIADKDDPFRRAFYEHPIDETISSRVGKIVIFTADDEKEDGKKSAIIVHNALGGEVISLNGHGHYTLKDMGTEEFPELLEAVLK